MQRITALILAITLLFTFGSTFVLADDAYEADSTLEESSAYGEAERHTNYPF